MNIRCMGCMEEYDSYFDVCPRCGTVKDSLPKDASFMLPGVILNKRYMAGHSLYSDDFSIIYMGYDLLELKKVIIKEYYPRGCASRIVGSNDLTIFEDERKEDYFKGLNVFLKDGNLLKKREIPGMAQVLDSFSQNKTAYIVQEYLEGESLEKYLSKKNRMEIEEALEIMLPVLDVLCQLHKENMCHLRVNPDNIFLTKFGEVKLIGLEEYQFDAIKHGKKISSIDMDEYIAPELKQASPEKNGCSDVYSVCAVLYRMITGKIPDEGVERMHRDNLVSPEHLGIQLSKSQNNMIMNGLAPNPKDRTQSMNELTEQLSSVREVERKEVPKSKEENSSLSLKTILCIGIPCVVVLVGILGFLVFQSHMKSSQLADSSKQETGGIAVPNLENADYETEAQKIAEEKGLELHVVNRVNSDSISKGRIVSQSPEAGTKSQDGGINVVVSAGMDKITLENVVGYDKKEQLKKAGFILIDESEESNIIPGNIVAIEDSEGNVLETGQEIPEGCAIKVKISIGKEIEENDSSDKEKVKVSDLIGLNFAEALQKAESKNIYIGLSEKEAYERESVANIGEICKMQLVSGENTTEIGSEKKVNIGSELLLTLSKGPKPVTLPSNYKGKDLNTVEKQLDDKNLIYNRSNYDYVYNSQYASGTVIKITYTCHHDDSLEGNLHWDDKVNLTISKGPEPVIEPETPSSSGGGTESTTRSKKEDYTDKKKDGMTDK